MVEIGARQVGRVGVRAWLPKGLKGGHVAVLTLIGDLIRCEGGAWGKGLVIAGTGAGAVYLACWFHHVVECTLRRVSGSKAFKKYD